MIKQIGHVKDLKHKYKCKCGAILEYTNRDLKEVIKKETLFSHRSLTSSWCTVKTGFFSKPIDAIEGWEEHDTYKKFILVCPVCGYENTVKQKLLKEERGRKMFVDFVTGREIFSDKIKKVM